MSELKLRPPKKQSADSIVTVETVTHKEGRSEPGEGGIGSGSVMETAASVTQFFSYSDTSLPGAGFVFEFVDFLLNGFGVLRTRGGQ